MDYKDLILGSAGDKTPGGYRMEVQLDQKGAGVESLLSSRYDAEFEGRVNPHLPLQLIRRDLTAPPSLSLTFNVEAAKKSDPDSQAENPDQESVGDRPSAADPAEDTLNSVLWDVVRDGGDGRSCR